MQRETNTKFIGTFRRIRVSRLDLLPSEYAERYLTLTSEVSTMTGRFRYDTTPYLREIVDQLSPYNPSKIVAIMKGAQIGLSTGVIINGIIWIIANNPGNIMMLSANDDLNKEMIEVRLDQAITSVGIRHLIRPNTIRGVNRRTGDTSKHKEFAGGRLYGGGLQSIDKLGKQRSIKYGFFDDWDAAKVSDKRQGSIFELIQQRFASSASQMKQFFISTPETRPSNIEALYLAGDQRKWMVPCPICGERIEILFNHTARDGTKVGVVWDLDSKNILVEDSVRYRCQKCEGEFKEKHKYDMNLKGKWIPTATPSRPGFVSYHVSAFISPPGMYSWTDYVYKWLDIFKNGNESKSKRKVFRNVVEGYPWEERKTTLRASQLSRNVRDYEPGVIPTALSAADGNGEIVLITCACDINGTLDDARLDFEVVAHCENQSTYSILQGSIGSYQPNNKDENRIIMSYKNEVANSVWNLFHDEVVNREYPTQDGRTMRITATGIDTGWLTTFAYYYIDSHPTQLMGIKGRTDDKFVKFGIDLPRFKPARERNNLYILETDLLKDDLAEKITLKWNKQVDTSQPPGFMNFPEPIGGQYSINRFFIQFEAEQKVLDVNDDGDAVGWKWVKKTSSAQNHFFDCRIYNNALRDIVAIRVCKELNLSKSPTWVDYVALMKKM